MKNVRTTNSSSRIIGLDILRLMAVIMIFLFHARMHMNLDFFFLSPFVGSGAIFMDLFFLISGFVTEYTTQNYNLNRLDEYKTFLLKKVAALYPSYVIASFIYCILFATSIKEVIVQIPMDLFLLQSTVAGSTISLHHGGTWFISCLFIAYLITPLISTISRQMNDKNRKIIVICIYLICSYMAILVHKMNYSEIYSNVIYRTLQFWMGMLICDLFLSEMMRGGDCKKYSSFKIILYIVVLLIVLVGLISIICHYIGGDYRDYDFVALFIFGLLIYYSAFYYSPNSFITKLTNSTILNYCSSIAYEFFLGQFFCFKIVNVIMTDYIDIIKLLVSFIICFVIAIILHELITKPFKKYILRSFL